MTKTSKAYLKGHTIKAPKAIKAPKEQPVAFINRRGFHSVDVQLVCDHRKYFLQVFARFPGSSHDIQAIPGATAFPAPAVFVDRFARTETRLLMPVRNLALQQRQVFLTTTCSIFAQETVNPLVGVLFLHVLERDYYQEGFRSFQETYGIITNTPITFSTNLDDHPDRPRWLRFTQRTAYHDGMLYGSPTFEDIGQRIIEVTAYNRKTFETTRQSIMFNVEQPIGLNLEYQVEFFVKNRDVEEVLPLEVQKHFMDRVQNIWESNHLTIINITSALDRGGRIPLPIQGRKEGVYIKVGSHIPFPSCLEEEVRPEGQCIDQLEPISCDDVFSPYFIINWCNISLIDKSIPDIPDADIVPGDGVLTDGGEFNPPSDSLEDRDYYLDYVVTITVPLAIGLILCLILAYIMCCRREGLEKRDLRTSDIQLVHHHSIQDNTSELRDLAKSREGLRPLSTLPMFNARTGERVPPCLPFNYDTSRVPLVLDQQEPHSDPYPGNQPKTQQQKDIGK
ncbi:alpha-sarcoglycan-like [Carcharodon carcharias]|uniref:alpha-sarcoglycan-like n=1 Tax=Carcharodon carcharias TaxID=13397 RepID=UPI001B7F59AA|nr:alpha-sarcoglycan-like [Carcharodon carcharias]